MKYYYKKQFFQKGQCASKTWRRIYESQQKQNIVCKFAVALVALNGLSYRIAGRSPTLLTRHHCGRPFNIPQTGYKNEKFILPVLDACENGNGLKCFSNPSGKLKAEADGKVLLNQESLGSSCIVGVSKALCNVANNCQVRSWSFGTICSVSSLLPCMRLK